MEKIILHPLKHEASRICLGTWAIGGLMWGGTDEADSVNTILSALDMGINIIDTAPVYGFGLAEKIVGQALAKHGKRDDIIIATKAGLEWQDGKIFRNSSPKRIRKEIEDSLQRLHTEYIDLYQIHWPDPKVPMQETAAVMLALLEEGKIRAIGVSNFSTAQMEAFMQVAPIHTSQPPYNLFERGIEKDVLPFTEKHSIVTLAYGSLCRGLLSGHMSKDTHFKGDDIRKIDPKFTSPHFEEYLAAVDALNQFAQREFGKSILALALRWVLDRGRTIALWGCRRPDQLAPMKEVLGWTLDANAMHQIDIILKQFIHSPLEPDFMAPPARKMVAAEE